MAKFGARESVVSESEGDVPGAGARGGFRAGALAAAADAMWSLLQQLKQEIVNVNLQNHVSQSRDR